MTLPVEAFDALFRQGRTFTHWLPRPVAPALLQELYELARLGPTSNNCQPGRFVFVTSPEAKERLKPALSAGNVDKTMSAPVTVIAAYDPAFYELLPRLNPQSGAGARDRLAAAPEQARTTAEYSAALQAGYLILAARALGLDCGPMGGFDRAQVDAAFFAGGGWRSQLLINLGYGDRDIPRQRAPRLDFAEACRVL